MLILDSEEGLFTSNSEIKNISSLLTEVGRSLSRRQRK